MTNSTTPGFWASIKNAARAAWDGIKRAAKATWSFLARNSRAILRLSLSASSLIIASNSKPRPTYGTRTTVVREHYRVNPDGRVSKVRAHARTYDEPRAYPYAGGAFRYQPAWEW